jgi:hypothetical protein
MEGRWHFRCPECGLGDGEHGRLAADHELHCEVCLDESGLTIRLERWIVEEVVVVATESDGARARRTADAVMPEPADAAE